MSSSLSPEPIAFVPLFMERVWGGRRLETLYRKPLPPGQRIGESWEIVDRAEAQSVVKGGPLAGETLHSLWQNRRDDIFGGGLPESDRFPLLLKLLDANESLSLQVHPPAEIAQALGGEAKTEMWYVTHAEPGAEIFIGLEAGTTRTGFAEGISAGRTADFAHHFPSRAGDTIYVPSGRLHALGAGNVVVEIMQNSDTTYRVSDWNRLGLDGRPRPLHIQPSMRSINFEDFAPGPLAPTGETLAQSEFFHVEKWKLTAARASQAGAKFAIFTVLSGQVTCGSAEFSAGDFFLVPGAAAGLELIPRQAGAELLRTTLPD
jgi:mannose-6-phosphate isomerase